jgi:hypothetical protein
MERIMGRRLAILQSNYIPWKGYFDLINSVDEFILYDTAQFTKNDWRNRNRIKTLRGPIWLTIPVFHHFGQSIQEVVISDRGWAPKHWATISQSYARAPHFADYKDWLAALFRAAADEKNLSRVNWLFLSEICGLLGVKTLISWSSDYSLVEGQTERLVNLCKQVGATEYVSGPAARAYLDERLFEQEQITVTYIDYSGYPEYRQLYPPFEHGVSILDLLLNEGPNASRFMKTSGEFIHGLAESDQRGP